MRQKDEAIEALKSKWVSTNGKQPGKISPTYFYKICQKSEGNIENIEREVQEVLARQEARKNKTLAPATKKTVRVNISQNQNNNYGQGYKIPTPTHLMGREEFYLYIHAHIDKSVNMLRNKYYTLSQCGIMTEDLISEIFIKCLRPTKEGVTIYDKYLANPNILVTIRCFVNTVCRNHFKDYLKGDKYTTPVVSMEKEIGNDNDSTALTIGDTIGKEDVDNTSIQELLYKCEEVKVKEVSLRFVVEQLLLGLPLTTVCRENNINPNAVRNKLLQVGVKEILGQA